MKAKQPDMDITITRFLIANGGGTATFRLTEVSDSGLNRTPTLTGDVAFTIHATLPPQLPADHVMGVAANRMHVSVHFISHTLQATNMPKVPEPTTYRSTVAQKIASIALFACRQNLALPVPSVLDSHVP